MEHRFQLWGFPLVPILYKDVKPNHSFNLMWQERVGFIPGGPPRPRTSSVRWPRPWRRLPQDTPLAAAAAIGAPPTKSLSVFEMSLTPPYVDSSLENLESCTCVADLSYVVYLQMIGFMYK